MTTTVLEVDLPDFDQARYDAGAFDGVVEILNRHGDSKHMWDKDSDVEVDLAKRLFDRAKKKGMLAYKVEGKEGVQGEVMTAFDPTAERMIIAPPMAGG